MCEIAIGTDTGGSTRIPARALRHRRLQAEPSAHSDRRRLSAVVIRSTRSGRWRSTRRRLRQGRCGDGGRGLCRRSSRRRSPACASASRKACRSTDLDDTVGRALSRRRSTRLEKAGARLSDEALPLIDGMVEVNGKGGLAPPEAYAIHRDRLARRGDAIDPNVRARIERAAKIQRRRLRRHAAGARRARSRAMDARLADIDVLVMPTTPIVAPTIAEMEEPRRPSPARTRCCCATPSIWQFLRSAARSRCRCRATAACRPG